MFGFSSRQIEKQISLPFQVVLELKEDGTFLAKVPHLPGCTARGRTKSEALRNIAETARHHVGFAGQGRFEPVWADASHKTLNTLSGFYGRLVAGSNRDGAFSSSTGDYGTWVLNHVTKATIPGDRGNGNGKNHDDDDEAMDLVDYTPQVYCLCTYAGAGAPKLYAGTSTNGSIYESVDGLHWEIAYATGEARVHTMAVYKDRLYAGTSAAGKLFCFTGTHWSLVHRSSETAISALAEFRGEFYMGTYPGGHIYASSDGVNWHLAYDSEQTFVRAFAVFENHLYAATSRSGGGTVFRTADGLRWEKVFESRDPNYYCLGVFHHNLWLGTGNNGRLYRSADGENWEMAVSLEDEGIRSLESFEGRLYLGTEGRGRIYRSTFADTLPPVIEDLRITDVTSHSAVIRWRTDRPADSLVRFGETTAVESSVQRHGAVCDHQVALSYLKSLTEYTFQAFSKCPDGSETAFSEKLNLTTAAAETAEIKSTTHADPEKWYKSPKAVISWGAPEGIVRYHYVMDQVPDTVPAPGGKEVVTTGEHSARFSKLDDGTWWFHLLAEDRAGNLGTQAVHFRVNVDTKAAPPRIQSGSHPMDGAWSNKERVHWTWEHPEDLSGIAGYFVLLDQKKKTIPTPETGIWTEDASFSAELNAEGDWWLHAVSVDNAGNVGNESGHYLVRLDRRADPPAVESVTHPSPDAWVNSANIQIHWSPPADASGVAGYYYIFDQKPETIPTEHSGTFTLSNQVNFSGKGDGVWYFHIVTADQAGNIGTEASHFTVKVDTWAAPPEIDSPTHPQGSWMPSSRVSIDLTPADDLSGIVGYYTLLDMERGTIPTPGKGTYTEDRALEFSGLTDGIWYLHVVSKDAAGNVGVEASHHSIRIDTEALPPLLSSTSHPSQDDWSRQASVDMVWDPPGDLSGVAHYYYLVDQEPDTIPTAHSGEKTTENRCRVQIKEDGTWYFHIVTQDRSGNVGRVCAHYKLKVDTAALPPRVICPTHPERGAWSNHVKPRFEWYEPEDSSGVVGYYYTIDRNEDTLPTPANGFYTTERYAVIDRGLDSDGAWYFHVVSRDRAGNVGIEASHYPVHIDTTANPPDLRSSTHPDRHGWSNNPNPVFEWVAPDDDSGIVGYYTVLNHSQATLPTESTGTWTEETKISFSGLEDGVWTLHIVSKDRCGNVGSRSSHYSIRVDTQALPPKVSSPSHPEGAWVRNATPTFTWAPPRDLSGIAGYYYLMDGDPSSVPTKDNGQFTTGTIANFPKIDDGMWVFHIVSVDQAGNVGTLATHYSVHVDTTANAPNVLSPSHPKADEWYAKSAPVLSWQAPEDPSGIAGYYYAVDQSPDTVPGLQSAWITGTQVTLPELPDGEWYFHIVTKDGAGNISEEGTHFPLKIDTSAPTPRVHSTTHPSSEDWFGDPKPTFVWDDGEDLSGIVGHFWSFDHQARATVQPSTARYTTGRNVTLPPQKDGVWYFHLAARDKAGNISEPANLMVKIETVAPKSRIEPLAEIISRPSFEVRWAGTDSVSGVANFDLQVREGSGEWKDWLSATSLKSSIFSAKDGVTYNFRIRGRDNAGNVEAYDDMGPWPAVAVDMSPPDPVKTLSAKAGPKGSILLAWTATTDNTSGVGFYRVYRSATSGITGQLISQDGQVSRCGFRDGGSDLSDGALYYYTVKAVDKAGNECVDGNAQIACVSDQSSTPPILASTTHPMPLDWYNLNGARLNWEEPADSTGIVGYYWLIDQNPNTIPTETSGKFLADRQLTIDGLKDGTWFVHVISKDKAGNISTEAAHYQLNIDTTPPAAPTPQSPSHPNPDAWSADNNASFNWNTPADPAQIAGYLYLLDQKMDTVPGTENGTWTAGSSAQVSQLEDGIWYFHVVAKDKAGNFGEQAGHCRIQVARTPPPPKITSPTHPNSAENYTGQTAVFHWATPPFSKPIAAFHYVLDQEKDTVPDNKDSKTTEGRAEFQKMADGDWVFHVISVDSSGRMGKMAAHFPIHVRSAGSIQGQVTRPNGILPAENVEIELYKGGMSLAKTTTNNEGRFRVHNLPLGEYALRLAAPGQPPQMMEGIRLDKSQLTLALSLEICALPNPSAGSIEVNFFVLARDAGALALIVYSEQGKEIEQLRATAPRAGMLKVPWNTGGSAPGVYLFQAVFKASDGRITKHPIRKIQLTAK